MLRIVLIIGAVLALLYVLGRFRALEAPARRRPVRFGVYALLAVVALVLLSRAGWHWVGVIGAAAWSAARLLVPLLLKLAPLLFRGTRSHTDESRSASSPGGGSSSGSGAPPRTDMSPEEARQVLNVQPGATREEILASYRTLIRKVHPDTPGGSTYLASKLNQAKDVLLGSA